MKALFQSRPESISRNAPPLAETPAGGYRADLKFTRYPLVLMCICIALCVLGALIHQIPLISLFGMVGLCFASLFLSAVTLRVNMTEEGLTRQWIWGWRGLAWHEIASIEKVRRQFFGDGMLLLNEKGYEVFAVSALRGDAQEQIAQEAIKRGRLRKDSKKLKKTVIARWVRK